MKVVDLLASETAIDLLIAYGDRAVDRARTMGRRAAEIGTREEIDHWLAVYLLLEKARRRADNSLPPPPSPENRVTAE